MKFSNSNAFSFGSSKRNNSMSNYVPGPGYYTGEITVVKRKAPGWKIGTSKRDTSYHFDMPGPGQYGSGTSFGKAPKYSFGIKSEKSKELFSGRDTPGPGNYTPNYNRMYKNVSYSILGKKDLNKVDQLPGPGHYTVLENLNNSAFKFGTEKKGNVLSENSKLLPGPGQYLQGDNFVTKTPKYSFGKDNRKINDVRPWTPGPGQYTAPQKIGLEGPKFSVGKSSRPFSSTKATNTLGPGAYSSGFYNKPKAPNTVFGKSKRDDDDNDFVPGPGMYAPNIEIKGKKNPAYSMGKSDRDGNKSFGETSIPGPGNYNIKETLGNGPKFSILGKHDKVKPNFQPGPGYYNTDIDYNVVRSKNPSWKIGTSKRAEKNYNLVPGPGMYDSKISRPSTGHKFGGEKRDWSKTDGNPGPGQYKIPYSIGEVPSYYTGAFNKDYKFI